MITICLFISNCACMGVFPIYLSTHHVCVPEESIRSPGTEATQIVMNHYEFKIISLRSKHLNIYRPRTVDVGN